MNTLDTRNLAERREELKQEILDSFLENFPHYEEMTESFEDIRFEEEEIESWKQDFEDELKEIEEIDDVENELGSEFEHGVTLVDIDYKGIAEDIKYDYTEVTYQGNSYLGRV